MQLGTVSSIALLSALTACGGGRVSRRPPSPAIGENPRSAAHHHATSRPARRRVPIRFRGARFLALPGRRSPSSRCT